MWVQNSLGEGPKPARPPPLIATGGRSLSAPIPQMTRPRCSGIAGLPAVADSPLCSAAPTSTGCVPGDAPRCFLDAFLRP